MLTMNSHAVLGVAALLALAGCLSADPNAPAPNATPRAPSPEPSPQPTPEPSPTPSESHPGGGMLVRPAHEENATHGFTLVGDEDTSGFIAPSGSVTFRFAGRNDGANASATHDPCGEGNPAIHIEDENGTALALHPPMMRCMIAITMEPFAGGATLEQNLTWNATAYRGDAAYTVAPGTYYAVGTFVAKRGETIDTIRVRVPVNVFDDGAIGIL